MPNPERVIVSGGERTRRPNINGGVILGAEVTALAVLTALVGDRPVYSQVKDNSNSTQTHTLIATGEMPSDQAYQQLLTRYNNPTEVSRVMEIKAANEDSPPNPSEFIRNTGEKLGFYTKNGTPGVFASGRTGIIDTTEVSLNKILKFKSQPPYKLYPENTYHVATLGHQYHQLVDLAYFIDTYFQQNEHPDLAHLVIRAIPISKINDPNAFVSLEVNLPDGIITGDNIRSFLLAPDFSYLDVGTKNYAVQDLNRINRVYLIKDGTKATGRVDALQYPTVHKSFVSVVLNQFRAGFINRWLGRYLH